jgi:ERO1-like protein alpha
MMDRIKEFDIIANTCKEETLLYQLISGLHASINMHVSSNYHPPSLNINIKNHTLYLNAIGFHEERLKNLYFIYATVLRAI